MKRFAQLLVVLGVMVTSTLLALPYVERLLYPLHYNDQVLHASQKYGVERNLVMAVIREESSFAPESTSRVQAKGLMQLLPSTAEWIASKRGIPYNASKLSDPEVNIDLGTWYLRYLLDSFNSDEPLAIKAYNAGITNVKEWEKQQKGYVAFPETDQFVKRVETSHRIYNRLYGEHWENQ